MSSKRPWMPLYIDDYLAGAAHLEVHEHGAYLLLMMRYWSKGSLPDDEEAIRRISRLSIKQWKECRETIKAFFHDGWRHERIDSEINKAIEKSKVNAANAAKSHENRKPVVTKLEVVRKVVAADPQPTLQTSDSTSPLRGEEAAPPKAASQGMGSQVDPEFKPADRTLDRYKELPVTEIDVEARKFIAYHQARESLSADWQASFVTWLEREIAHRAKLAKPAKAAPRIEVNSDPDWDSYASRFARGLGWPKGVGPDPDSAACRCPPDILAKHNIGPKAKVQA